MALAQAQEVQKVRILEDLCRRCGQRGRLGRGDFCALEGLAVDLVAQLPHAPSILRSTPGIKGAGLGCLERHDGDQVAPAQLCRQRRHNLRLRESLCKLHHSTKVARFETAAEFLRQLLAQVVEQAGAVAGTLATQYFGGQALPDGPVQPGQLGIHRAGQALAAGSDQRAQLGVQAVRWGVGY